MFGCPFMECSCGAYFCWNCSKSPPDCDGGRDSQDEEHEGESEPNVFVNEETISVEDRDEGKFPVDGAEGCDLQEEEDHGKIALGDFLDEESGFNFDHVDDKDKSKRPVDGMRSAESRDDVGHGGSVLNTESLPAALKQTEREDSILTLKAPKPATKVSENPEVEVANTTAPKDQDFAIYTLHENATPSVEEARHAGPATVLDLERSRRTSSPDIVNGSSLQHLLRQIDTDSHQTGFDSSKARPKTDRPIDLDAGRFARWANGSENFGAEPGDLPHSSRVQVWDSIHTPHIVALHWPVEGEYRGDPTLMECNRCVSRVRPMYLFDEDEEKKGDAKEEADMEEEGVEKPSSPKAKRRKSSDSYSAVARDAHMASTAAVEPHYSPRSKACDLDRCNRRNGTSEHSRPDQAWICWKCALIVCRKCKDRYVDEPSYEAKDR
jgi:hypothetical protein